jgi:class 3 adenylate cyclase
MIDLNYILTKFPWESRWTDLGEPLDFLWEFELKVTREDIWPYLIDTSSFNQRLGLPKFNYIETDGKLFGTTKQGGMRLEWEEVPWEWEYLKEIGNARIYSKGFSKYLRVRFILEPYGESRSRLYVYFGWIPKNFLMKRLLLYAMPKLEADFRKVFGEIQTEIQKNANASYQLVGKLSNVPTFIGDVHWVHPEKLDQVKEELIRSGIQPNTIEKVYDYLRKTGDNGLDRIRIKSLSKTLGRDSDELLKMFLYGCRLGIFTLSWDIICPHCRGVRTSLQKLGDLPEKDDCEVCEIEFETTGQNSIEVTFHLHPSVRIIEKQMYCAAEPATKKHIILSKSVQPGKSFSTNLLIQSGVYRLRKKGKPNYNLVEVNDKYEDKEIVWLDENGEKEIQVKTKPGLVFQNEESESVTIVMEERKEDQLSLRPKELFNFNEFRDLFSEEAIATNLQLDIGVQTLLFTDIVGSTRFYESVGDHGAFLQVREHFIKAYTLIKNEKGAVVKTIGDAIMASFPSPLLALRAAKEMQEWFHPENKHTPVRIRISIHTGNCLAVNLNSNIDYFGNTVNYAAKMQNVTQSGEISISEAVFRDQDLREYLRKKEIKLRKVDFPLSWTDRTDSVYIWKA